MLLKVILLNVTALTVSTSGPSGTPGAFALPNLREKEGSPRLPRSNRNLAKQLRNLGNGVNTDNDHTADQGVEELNAVRLREITSKAIAGTILLLLRWFKLSRKFGVPEELHKAVLIPR